MFKLNRSFIFVAALLVGNSSYSENPSAANRDSAAQQDPAVSKPQDVTGSKLSPIKQRMMEWMLTDQKFVDKVLESGRAEIELSQLALQKSTAQPVKDFAQRMVDDHSKASLELKTIAQAKNMNIPLEMDSDHAKELKKLQALDGAGFDAAYIDLMVEDHEKNVSLFTVAGDDKKLDAQLKTFAQKTLPTLKEHLTHAKALGKTDSSAQR